MEAAFDQVAEAYDSQFTDTAVGRLQRMQVHSLLSPLLARWQNPSVLELNCGTGADARWMAAQGAQVFATDLSSGMIEVAKSASKGIPKLEFEAVDLRTITKRKDKVFDVVFSNFGGLNCIDEIDLAAFAEDLQAILSPGGIFVGVIMPKMCLWESLYFLAKGKPKSAMRRWNGGPVVASLGNGGFQNTWYHSPATFKMAFDTGWTLEALHPIGFFVPPSYLDGFFEKRSGLLSRLGELDAQSIHLGHRAGWADHFLVAFSKTH